MQHARLAILRPLLLIEWTVFNTDQGSQFTDSAFTGVLATNGIAIRIDGKGAQRALRDTLGCMGGGIK